jgi:alkylation response protein AidB-like acyl-CoA dehydrogenase
LWPTLVGALVEPPGDEVVACALAGECALDGGKVFGIATAVPAVHLAAHVVVAAGEHVVVVDPRGPGVEAVRERTTSGEPLFTVTFDGAPATASRVPPSRLVQTATVALCALQVGVAERALRMTAEYTSSREQFGRPLATFQAVQQRAADAYIDVEAMRWTMWQAAWRLDAEGEAADAVDVAKFWASEGGARVLAAAQHLHGGIGVDLDYPLHRYLVWSKQLEVWLGGASARLASIGDRIAVGGV